MNHLLAACALVLAVTPAFAEDKPKPNTLTPKEIADGWILLFDGETAFGWAGKDGEESAVTATGGILTLSGKGTGAKFTSRFQSFEFTGEYRTKAKGCQLAVGMRLGGASMAMGDGLRVADKDEWRPLIVRLTPQETLINADEAGKSGISGAAIGPVAWAQIGFRLAHDGGKVELRNLKLRPLGTQSFFDGKNLDGWKVNAADPKRMASKFAVTKDGELSVKNGPGDLVSEKEFDNFILQFECKTLGKGLNSGVFFRCIPGQYQNGYEAQIQNLFAGGDRTRPVDFGTGAIYRRVPARKVVSNDDEWFTVTIAADGPHIATWVNGYQTVDWIDTRKASDNPRQGYRAAKGPISIQGHDPTTNLLFRKIRLAELPAK